MANLITKPIEEQITAIILAGGESSRMGEDKALLNLDNRTLLSQVCLVAKECSAQTYVVTPWIDRYRDFLPPSIQLISEKLVLGATSNTPLIGFFQGIQVVQTEWILLLACDLPYLSSLQVKQWSFALTTVLPAEIALLPRNSKGWEPLCGFYRRSCLASLKAHISQGGRSFQTWLNKHEIRELAISDRKCLFNCNTPEDWKVVREQNFNAKDN